MTDDALLVFEVRLFGRYREFSSTQALELALPAGASVGDLVAELHRRSPGPLPARPVVAVNQVAAPDVLLLQEGDEVALIPPVSGG